MKQIFKYTLIIIIVFIALKKANAQYKDIDKQKATVVFNISKYLIWEDDANLDILNIAAFNCSKEMIKALDKNKPKQFATGIEMNIKKVDNVNQINEYFKIVYVGTEGGMDDETKNRIVNKSKDLSIALFTDSWNEGDSVMFNLQTQNNNVLFEYDLNKLGAANITVNEEFYVLGGSDIYSKERVSRIKKEIEAAQEELKEQEILFENKKEELAKIKDDLLEQTRIVEEQKIIVEQQEQKVKKQNQQIEKQKNNLNATKSQLDAKVTEIEKSIVILEEQKAKVSLKEKEINRIKTKIENYELELNKQTKLLEEQRKLVEVEKERIKSLNKDIDAKQAKLTQLGITIEVQRYALAVFIVLLFVIIILLFFIYRNFREKKKQNVLLEEKNAEIEAQSEELAKANLELEKLSIVASETVNAVAILDNLGEFDWVNEGYTKLYGYNLHLLKTELGENIQTTSTNPEIHKIVTQCVEEKKSVKFETQVQAKSGNKLWVQTTLTPIIDYKDDVIKLVSIDSDITEIKEAEEQIKIQNQKIINQSQELEEKNVELAKLSLVAERTDNAVIIADSTGEIEWVNPGFEKLHEATIEEHKELHGSNIVNFDLSSEILDQIAKNLKEQKSVTYSTKTKTGKGKELWLQTTLTPMYDQEGSLTKLFAIDADITQIKIAEQKIAKQNHNITNSIIYASRIQTAILPPREYIKTVLPQHFIIFRPRDIVSGDYYWVTNIKDKVLFTAADSTGHGVPGAFMSMLGIAFLNDITGKSKYEDLKPSIILNKLRAKVKLYLRQTGKDGESKDGYDISFCVYDKSKNELQFAGAHNPLLLVRDNKMIQYLADEMPVGIYYKEKESFTNHIIKPQKDDMIYMFSDGYPDQFGGTRKRKRKFMIKRFRNLLVEINNENIYKQKEILETKFDQWKGKYEQLDDVIVMGMRLP